MVKYAVAVLSLIASFAQAAELPQMAIDGEQSFTTAKNLKIQGLKDILDELEYPENAAPRVFQYDLNDDNHPEILIQSSESLCGNGGCVYVLIDGKSRRKIADLFGNPLLIHKKKKEQSFPDIETFSHTGSDTGVVEIFSYSGGKYKSKSRTRLSGRRLEKYLLTVGKVAVVKSR